MPSLEEHCGHTLKRYGIEGREIHQWLDEPSRKHTSGHRQFRHDTETIKLVGKIFGEKYGREMAENIALDHIMLDHKEKIKRRKEEKRQQIYRGFTEEEREDFYSQPPPPYFYRLYLELKKRRKKKTWFGKTWFPLNENSSFWDCELCGKRAGRFLLISKLKTVYLPRGQGFPPRDRIRVCSECRDKMRARAQFKKLDKLENRIIPRHF